MHSQGINILVAIRQELSCWKLTNLLKQMLVLTLGGDREENPHL